jgi:hypothetical protein
MCVSGTPSSISQYTKRSEYKCLDPNEAWGRVQEVLKNIIAQDAHVEVCAWSIRRGRYD